MYVLYWWDLGYNYMQHHSTDTCRRALAHTKYMFRRKGCKSARNVPLSIRSVTVTELSYWLCSHSSSVWSHQIFTQTHAKGWCTRLQKCTGGIARCKLTRVVLGLPSYSERGKHRAQCNSHIHHIHSMARWKREGLTNCSGRKERWLWQPQPIETWSGEKHFTHSLLCSMS